ncbi:MAG TPA: hypothetical protein VGJ55_00805 [Pyrinomonadaceae bacterium]
MFHNAPFNCHGDLGCSLLYHFADPPHQIGVQHAITYDRDRRRSSGLTRNKTELKLTAAAIIVGLQDAQDRLENTRSNRHAKPLQIEGQTQR